MLKFIILTPTSTLYSTAKRSLKSDTMALLPVALITLRGKINESGAIPVIPIPLLGSPEIIPETSVPWKKSSSGYGFPSTKFHPYASSSKPKPSSSSFGIPFCSAIIPPRIFTRSG